MGSKTAKTPGIPADLATFEGEEDAPKMEMAALPTGDPMPIPGMVAPAAPVFVLPELTPRHFYEVFPHMAPKAAGPKSPGVFLNADGSIYTPRQRKGGQFAAHRIQIQHKWEPTRVRTIVVPVNTMADDYGVAEYEQVSERTEVIFDFEDQMQNCLEAFGRSGKSDPLSRGLSRMGLASAYDDPATTPGLQGQRFAQV